MFAACAITLFSLMSMIHSAPPNCEDLVRPLDQLDPRNLEGRWALVAGSLSDTKAMDVLKGRDSVTLDFQDSAYVQSNRFGDLCLYYPHNVSWEGHIVKMKVKLVNFTGTFRHTSCADCVAVTLDINSSNHTSTDFYLLSRRREVDPREIEEFKSQVECLNMPSVIVMDPTKELCPKKTGSQPEAQT